MELLDKQETNHAFCFLSIISMTSLILIYFLGFPSVHTMSVILKEKVTIAVIPIDTSLISGVPLTLTFGFQTI
jgi:hypothetical protein